MIEIDLLPLELRKKKKIPIERIERIFKTKLIFAVLGSLVLIHLFLYLITAINTKRINIIKRNWQGLSSQRAQLDQLQGKLTKITEKIPLIEQLISNRVLWSKKLNIISDAIIPGIWLGEITLEWQKAKTGGEPSEYLIIRGSAASRMKDEPALIGRFMQNLKDDLGFSVDFAAIELGPIKKRLIKRTEVMDFALICRFKADKTQALLK